MVIVCSGYKMISKCWFLPLNRPLIQWADWQVVVTQNIRLAFFVVVSCCRENHLYWTVFCHLFDRHIQFFGVRCLWVKYAWGSCMLFWLSLFLFRLVQTACTPPQKDFFEQDKAFFVNREVQSRDSEKRSFPFASFCTWSNEGEFSMGQHDR